MTMTMNGSFVSSGASLSIESVYCQVGSRSGVPAILASSTLRLNSVSFFTPVFAIRA